MTWYDLSLTLAPGVAVYPGDPPYRCESLSAVDPKHRASFRVSALSLGSHSGTHVDAPAHFVSGGPCVAAIAVERLCGAAKLCDLSHANVRIERGDLEALPLQGVRRLLLRTRQSARPWSAPGPEDAHLSAPAATYLRELGVGLVGIDSASVDAVDSVDFAAHHALLEGPDPVIIVEGLRLAGVPAGDGELFCLPLALADAEAAPARVIWRAL